MTSFEKQYWDVKAYFMVDTNFQRVHFDKLVFFNKGMFWELFEDDARLLHTKYNINISKRANMYSVGFPKSRFTEWAARLLGDGYFVAKKLI